MYTDIKRVLLISTFGSQTYCNGPRPNVSCHTNTTPPHSAKRSTSNSTTHLPSLAPHRITERFTMADAHSRRTGNTIAPCIQRTIYFLYLQRSSVGTGTWRAGRAGVSLRTGCAPETRSVLVLFTMLYVTVSTGSDAVHCPEGMLELDIGGMHHLLAMSPLWLGIFQIISFNKQLFNGLK